MKLFDYKTVFVNMKIYNIDDLVVDKKPIDIANIVEKRMLAQNNNVDAIRNNIVLSYTFKKDLKLEERYNYVRGLIYSRQYISYEDYEDVVELFSEFNLLEDEIYKTIFSSRDSNEEDKDFIKDYINIFNDSTLMLNEIVKRNDGDEPKIISLSYSNEDSQDEDFQVEYYNDIKLYYKILSDTINRVKQMELNYTLYKKSIMKSKNIKDVNSVEYKYVEMGMDDYYNFVIESINNLINKKMDDLKRNSKNLALTI